MIALTDSQAHDIIFEELSLDSADDVLNAIFPLWWMLYAPKEGQGDSLQYLYTKRAALDYVLKPMADQITVKSGDDQHNNRERFLNLMAIRDNVEDEILKIETWGRNMLGTVAPASTLPDAYGNYLKRQYEF